MSRRYSRQGQKSAARVKIAPYVVPTRMPPRPSARMVPARWVKFVFAIFLLPVCVVLSQTFFSSFARATVAQRLWTGEAFWFFSLGAALWLIAFFGLPRPVVVYVFGHELTHAIWVWLMGGRVTQFNVSRDGGYVVTNKTNFWIALAPYFFPIYGLLAIAVYWGFSFCFDVQPYARWLYAVLGATWAFHLTFTCWMVSKDQTDLRSHGTFFSLVIIYLMNLLLLCVMLILASPQTSFARFGGDLVRNTGDFTQKIVDLGERFHHGAGTIDRTKAIQDRQLPDVRDR
jgi:hypothetical protein